MWQNMKETEHAADCSPWGEIESRCHDDDLETIQIDGYFVRCAAVTQIEHIVLWNEETPKDANGDSRLVLLKPQ
jgi:hypothetical protein